MQQMRYLILGAALAAVQGCYTYVPLDASVAPAGEKVALHITDQGRVGLAERLGPGVVRVEGLLTSSDTNDYVMNLFRVAQLGVGTSRWTGETVRVNRIFVGRVERRQLSRGRTMLVVGVATVGVVAFIASRGLFGSFNREEDPLAPPPPGSSILRVIRISP